MSLFLLRSYNDNGCAYVVLVAYPFNNKELSGDKYMNNVINISGESKKYIRAKEICGMFNIARSTVDNWAKYGLLTRRPIGGGIFYDYEEVKKLPRVRNGKNS